MRRNVRRGRCRVRRRPNWINLQYSDADDGAAPCPARIRVVAFDMPVVRDAWRRSFAATLCTLYPSTPFLMAMAIAGERLFGPRGPRIRNSWPNSARSRKATRLGGQRPLIASARAARAGHTEP